MVVVWDELATIMSSTYTSIKIVRSFLCKKKKKREVSPFEGENPNCYNFILSLEYHALGVCFKPYIALSSLHT
jgi:hypothetical protein